MLRQALLFCGTIPVTLLGYDERSGWVQYSGTMPYTKIQIVSEKYLISLFAQLTMLVATGIAQAVKMTLTGGFILGDFAVLMLTVSTLASSIPLPFIFKMGVEKGRVAYYVMMGFVCGASALISGFLKGQPAAEIKPNWVLEILAVIGIGTYFFLGICPSSFIKSVKFNKSLQRWNISRQPKSWAERQPVRMKSPRGIKRSRQTNQAPDTERSVLGA